ncbi:hypothetical protein L1987_42891 [Smallanthus sonchifolius]|uniref:Uncharacterized protein n=1 Tax=Smallanthus sonchifolius TaxID=185202 RepID=A0ACB9GJK9_9ASTR|nr:hypothetical protein L1987_42891 [Smallanthus sonchifolius]
MDTCKKSNFNPIFQAIVAEFLAVRTIIATLAVTVYHSQNTSPPVSAAAPPLVPTTIAHPFNHNTAPCPYGSDYYEQQIDCPIPRTKKPTKIVGKPATEEAKVPDWTKPGTAMTASPVLATRAIAATTSLGGPKKARKPLQEAVKEQVVTPRLGWIDLNRLI